MDVKLSDWGITAQLLAFYLSTSPHASMIGIYYLPITFIAHETGIDNSNVKITLDKLSEINFCTYDDQSEYIWVHDFAFDQLGTDLKANDNRVKGFHDAFNALPKLPFINAFIDKYAIPFYMDKAISKHIFTLEGPSKALLSNKKENEERKEEEINNNKNKIICYEDFKIDIDNVIGDIDENLFENLSIDEQAIEILKFFNETMGTSYPSDNENLKLIITYLESGVTTQQCFYVIANKHRAWSKNDVMKAYLKLEVIFGKKFQKYIAELRKPKMKVITA